MAGKEHDPTAWLRGGKAKGGGAKAGAADRGARLKPGEPPGAVRNPRWVVGGSAGGVRHAERLLHRGRGEGVGGIGVDTPLSGVAGASGRRPASPHPVPCVPGTAD